MPSLSLSLLGPVQVTMNGQNPVRFRTNKVQALLIYLAVQAHLSRAENVAHRREALMELLWPEANLRSAQDNLRQTLYQLRKSLPALSARNGETSQALVVSTHQAIQLNPDCVYELDVASFNSCIADSSNLNSLMKAAELYRGEFLSDFYLSDSAPFEEWASNVRADLQRRFLDALTSLTQALIQQGRFESAEEYARRQLVIDSLRESSHRQLMHCLALSGQRSAALAHFDTCRQILKSELDIEPSAETIALYEQIRDQSEAAGPARISQSAPSPGILPAFLQEAAPPESAPRSVFVARQKELAALERYLQKSLQGSGQMVFVIGSAGRGKTALLNEFSQQAMRRNPSLLVLRGNCNAYSGMGDPYLPFRDVMDMLTGDVEASWSAGAISREHARRLWTAFPQVVESLLTFGSHLIDIFVSSSAIAARASHYSEIEASWYPQLETLLRRQQTRAAGFEQSQLFQQFSNLLGVLAEDYPLLILLDDVQWADAASISLLFHIARRIEHGRILVACAYRPDEVALGRDGQRHPLEQALAEFKRQFGNVWIDLGAGLAEDGQQFVDALLETEPNRLDLAFRQSLARHTQGHPLFTIELLREMRERGDIVRDPEGYWIRGPSLDWKTLPARVEATIGERINRLDDELREMLTVASVEGEDFTAQVVAHVLALKERQVLRTLSQQLERRHRLVKEQGERQINHRRLNRFRFTHALYQQFLYDTLSTGESRLLHREIAGALENLFAQQEDTIAVQLARHYAGDDERERHYARLAGERAAAQFANDEAVNYLSRALKLTPRSDYLAQHHLLSVREEVYDIMGEREHQNSDLKALEQVVDLLDDKGQAAVKRRAQLALRQANYAQNTSDFSSAIKATRVAIKLAKATGDVYLEAAGHLQWGESLWRLANFEACRIQVERALQLSREAASRQLEADSRRLLGNVYYYIGEYSLATEYYSQGLQISREIGDRSGEASGLSNLGEAARAQGDYTAARDYYLQRLRICLEIGERYGENIALNNLGLVAHNLDENERALEYCQQALQITLDIGNRSFQAYNLTTLAHALAGLGRLDEAAETYRKSIRLRRKLGELHLATESIAGLASILLREGEIGEALAEVEHILNYLQSGTLDGTDEPMRVYLACYETLNAAADERAAGVLQGAYQLLQSRASKIADERLRRSYLENVSAHRRIVDCWQAQ